MSSFHIVQYVLHTFKLRGYLFQCYFMLRRNTISLLHVSERRLLYNGSPYGWQMRCRMLIQPVKRILPTELSLLIDLTAYAPWLYPSWTICEESAARWIITSGLPACVCKVLHEVRLTFQSLGWRTASLHQSNTNPGCSSIAWISPFQNDAYFAVLAALLFMHFPSASTRALDLPP